MFVYFIVAIVVVVNYVCHPKKIFVLVNIVSIHINSMKLIVCNNSVNFIFISGFMIAKQIELEKNIFIPLPKINGSF